MNDILIIVISYSFYCLYVYLFTKTIIKIENQNI